MYYRPDIVVGHSLGGGLASYVAIRQGKTAATINPAPLNLMGAGGSNVPGRIVFNNKVLNYVVNGEALDLLIKGQFLDVLNVLPPIARVGTVNYVPSIGADPLQKHLLRYLSTYVAPMPA